MKRYTISQIAAANRQAGGHYFDQSTMRFFGQTRRMFSVTYQNGRVFVFAARFDEKQEFMGYSFAEFHPSTSGLTPITCLSPESMKAYLESLPQPGMAR